MKIIRRGTFETNSSSTHSITMCSESDFDKWKNGELYYCQEDGKFYDDAGRSKLIKEQIIHSKAKYNDGKYTYKDVTKDGLTKDFYIHRLVGEVFLNKPNYKCEISHKDTNKQNNVYTNLEWVTHKENQNNPISVNKQLGENNHRFGKRNDYNSYKHRCYKIKCIETNKIYLSIHKASNETGIPFSSIQYHLKGKLDNAGGYHWQKL